MGKRIYYKNGMCGGTKKDRDSFYSTLHKIQNQALSHNVIVENFYDRHIYHFKNMKIEYLFDPDYGIPYSIEYFV